MSSRFPAWQPRLHARPVQRRAVLLSSLAVPVGLLATKATPAAARQSASTQLTLPAPTGHYRLGTVSLDLIDTSRPDPWVPAIPFREFVIQLWYPAQDAGDHPRAPYFTPATARAYEQEQGLPVLNWPVTHAHLGAPVLPRAGGWPVLLFSPGLGDQRSDTTCLVEDLASRGYVVVTIDYVHDCGIVELPDGRVESTAIPEITSANEVQVSTKEVESRAADVSFILEKLAVISYGGNPDHERRPLPRGLCRALDLSRVGMFGHSDGGSTAAHMMNVDRRVKAGVDLDGTLWTHQAVAGSGGALLLFGEQTLATREAASWDEFWTKQRGPKRQLSLLGSTHATFTDFAALVPQVALILGQLPSWVIQLIGTIDGERAVAAERAYLSAWFDRYLRHHPSDLLTGPSARFPEVAFVR